MEERIGLDRAALHTRRQNRMGGNLRLRTNTHTMLKHRVGIEEIFQKSIQCLACTRPWFNPQYQERKKEKSFF